MLGKSGKRWLTYVEKRVKNMLGIKKWKKVDKDRIGKGDVQ